MNAAAAPPLLPVIALFFAACFAICMLLLDSRIRTRRMKNLSDRIRNTAVSPGESMRSETSASTPGFGSWVPEPVTKVGEAVARAAGVTARLESRLERANMPLKSGEFVALTTAGALGGGVLVGLLLQGIVFGVVGLVVAVALPRILLSRAIRRRSDRLHEQLPDILMILATSLRSGHSFLQSLDMVSKQVAEPGAEEFARVVAEIRLGRSPNEALLAMADRADSQDLRWAVVAMNVQREVGGNLAEVLDTIAETLREREVIRRQVGILSAEGRLSAAIMLVLPFVFGLYMAKVSPANFRLLFSTSLGLSMVATSGALLAIGFIWLKKVVNIDV